MTSGKLVTASVGTTLVEAKRILHEHRIEKLPVVDESGRLKGLITVKDIQKAIKYPTACKDALGRGDVAADQLHVRKGLLHAAGRGQGML